MTEHKIEESVAVYLIVRDGKWVVDPTTVDGYTLFSNYENGPLNEDCDCEEPEECERARLAADKLPFPNGEDLIGMLKAAVEARGPVDGRGE